MKLNHLLAGCLLMLGLCGSLWAQPANNSCGTATNVASTSCTAGTTVNADDSWVGSVGCQSGGNHNDVWYRFVATQNQLNINITTAGLGNNVEFILAESPCGSCACSFVVAGSACGPAPLVDSIVGLNIGSTYYYTVSSSGADGGFTACITNLAAVNRPGQDCPTASNICDEDPFGQSSIASGSGAISGLGSQEDVNTLSCFGSSERQSQWYKFTCSTTGTIEFNINPIVSGDDYDFLLLDITTSGCNLLGGPATVVACNWSGCKGSTGITSAVGSEPGVVSSGAGCFGGPAAWLQTPPTITACRNYLLLIDNFSLSNTGFNFTWGGATGGMTATIGPAGAVGFTPSVVTTSPCRIHVTSTNIVPCYTYTWTWGDGTTSTGTAPSDHTYAGVGPWTITQTITDPNGCEAVTSQTITCALPAERIALRANPSGSQVGLELILPINMLPDRYTIEHSSDGRNFMAIAEVRDMNGVVAPSYYNVHRQPTVGTNYYRALVRDLDGFDHASEVVEVIYRNEATSIAIAPNPANDHVEVSMLVQVPGPVDLQLLDAQGRLVRAMRTNVDGDLRASFVVDLSDLAAGAYFVKVRTAQSVYTRLLMRD
jgi:hypothetical protein